MYFYAMLFYFRKTTGGQFYTGTTDGRNAWIYTTRSASNGPDVREYKDFLSPVIDSSSMTFSLGFYRNYEANNGGHPE